MKTILLTFFLTCMGLWAQAPFPAPVVTTNTPEQDAALRNALRSTVASSNNVPALPAPATTPVMPAPRGSRVRPTGAGVPVAPVVGGVPVVPGAVPIQTQPTVPPPGVPGGLPVAVNDAGTVSNKPPEEVIAAGEINFPGVGLEEVLKIYAQLVNRTPLHAALPPVTITLVTQTPLTRPEAIQAIESVMAMNQIAVINVGDKFVKIVPAQLAPLQGMPFSTNDSNQLPESDSYVTQIVSLKYLKPSDVMQALQPLAQLPNSIIPIENNSMLIIRDYASNVKRMLELIAKLDVVVPLEWDSEVIPIKYAQADDISSALSSLGGGGGTSIGTGARAGGAGGAGRVGGLGGGGIGGVGGIGGGGGINGLNGGIGGIGGNNGAAGSRTSSLSDRIGAIVKKAAGAGDFNILGNTKIIADKRTNSLLVFASKQDMDMIKKIVGQLDIVLAQVLIEAIIMEVSLSNQRNLSVSYLQTHPSTPGNYFSGIGAVQNGTFLNSGNFNNTSGTNTALASGLNYFATFGGDFQATVTAVAEDSRITVLSRPYVQTSHGVPASLEVGDTVPEVTGTYFGGINGQASSQYQQTFVGISLTVTPLINPDGLVVMDITQDVEQLGQNVIIDGNPVPTTSKRTAQATVSVRDRDTIILGGMISSSKTASHSGVPFLKDIPVLGNLFRSSIDDSDRKELIVLIHPTVLPNPEDAALTATHKRDNLPAIKAADAEERRDAIRRIKQGNKIVMPRDPE